MEPVVGALASFGLKRFGNGAKNKMKQRFACSASTTEIHEYVACVENK